MKIWMDVMRTIEPVLADHERLFDAWAAGGVDGLVIGPLLFDQPKLYPGLHWETGKHPQATFDPNPAVYRRFGVEPPPAPALLPDKRRQLEQTLTAAKDRGWSVWLFQASAGMGPGGDGHIFADEQTQAALCARMVDTLAHYPMADGAIMDGPEWGYEIAPHHMNHRSYIFNDLPTTVAPACQRLGYDYAALVAAKDRLYQQLHQLDGRRIRLHAAGGLVGSLRLLGGDANLAAWLQFRVDSLTAFFRNVHTAIDSELGSHVKLGVGPRTAAFAPLCGYDFGLLADFMDILLPKHYFFHRGFDGLIGTVYRYVETLTAWNPGLRDEEALAVVQALFGLTLPAVTTRLDCEDALTPAFFAQVVTQETERALAAVDDPARIVPWVDAGRAPHDGDPMTAGHLRQLLVAAQSAGLQRFLYHHQGNLTAGEWAVMSDLCGEPWHPLTSAYQPSDELVL